MAARQKFLTRLAQFVLIAALSLTSIAAFSDSPVEFGGGFCLVCNCNRASSVNCGGACILSTAVGCGPGGLFPCDGCC